MPTISKIGDTNPFLHVSLQKGEKVFAESDAMVMMDAELELTGKMQGGILSSLARKLANDESLFMQELRAPRGDGDALFAPATPGDIEILDVGDNQYCLNDGAFLLCTEHVELKTDFQNPFNALFSGTGGFIIGKTSGRGKVAIGGLGAIFSIDVVQGKDIIVDNNHVVAWDSRLSYKPSISTSSGGGFVKRLWHSQTTGEGIVTRYSGTGKVFICSRNPTQLAQFIQGLASGKKPSPSTNAPIFGGLTQS